MMKNRIHSLLASDSLDRSLPQHDIDSELMERMTAVMAVEGWAQHEDYVEKIEHFVDQLSQYGTLIAEESPEGEAFRGIVLFINGIAQGQHNVNGFRSQARAESGWLLCQQAGERLARHYDAQGGFLQSLFFKDLGEWFGAIHAAQTDFLETLPELTEWHEASAAGFANVMPMVAPYFQGRLLGGLAAVANHPVVRVEIFDKYIAALHQSRQELQDAGETAKAKEVEALIAFVEARRSGFGSMN
jgi:hypothetical protein